jgi:hypothetical protein
MWLPTTQRSTRCEDGWPPGADELIPAPVGAGRRGNGSMIGGRVTLVLDRSALRRLAAGRWMELVSGTDGKTTTSHTLAAALGSLGPGFRRC